MHNSKPNQRPCQSYFIKCTTVLLRTFTAPSGDIQFFGESCKNKILSLKFRFSSSKCRCMSFPEWLILWQCESVRKFHGQRDGRPKWARLPTSSKKFSQSRGRKQRPPKKMREALATLFFAEANDLSSSTGQYSIIHSKSAQNRKCLLFKQVTTETNKTKNTETNEEKTTNRKFLN